MRLDEKKKIILRPDSKGRITLGKMAYGISSFKVTQEKNTDKIILEPYVEIPFHEKWLFENKEALSRVKTGLKESSKNQLKDRGSFAKYIND